MSAAPSLAREMCELWVVDSGVGQADGMRIDCTEEDLYSAVVDCSIEKLREREDREGRHWAERQKSAPEARFFRSGTSSSFSELSPIAREQISRKWGDQMLQLGYK